MHVANAKDGGFVGIEILCVVFCFGVFFPFCFVFLELAVRPYSFSPASSDSFCGGVNFFVSFSSFCPAPSAVICLGLLTQCYFDE